MAPTTTRPREWFRDFDHYAMWFAFWGTLFFFVQPVTADQVKDAGLWTVKAHQAAFGTGFGIVCALAFTILQNGFNRSRTKSISWIFAIGSWAVISMFVALVRGRFG
ncbi:MAG TPA: hypothetical protein VNH42_06165 [Mariprofundaceae bacterium]|nr:hypothetical protein [Mariprofundaceae bacterium]